jgi:hypothetical protein
MGPAWSLLVLIRNGILAFYNSMVFEDEMNSFPKADVLAACAKYGPQLKVPTGLDGERLMVALASNESSLGANCGPRHEPAYDVGGTVWASSPAQRALVAQYGRLGASSFGPWQTMLINCPAATPAQLETDISACAAAFVAFFNSYVAHQQSANVAQIGQIWNCGHIYRTSNPPPGVVQYCADLQKAYNLSVKQSASAVS